MCYGGLGCNLIVLNASQKANLIMKSSLSSHPWVGKVVWSDLGKLSLIKQVGVLQGVELIAVGTLACDH